MREFVNAETNHLGVALPKGRLRFYRRDADSQLQFVGENEIDHTPREETIRVTTGNSFDLVGERKATNFRMDSSEKWINETFEIKLRNHKKEPVEIRVVEHLYRWSSWDITEQSDDFKKTDAQTIEFRVPVQPDVEKTMTYTVHFIHGRARNPSAHGGQRSARPTFPGWTKTDASPSMQHGLRRRAGGQIEQFHTGDGLDGLVAVKGPHHAFVRRDFDQVGRGANLIVPEPVGHDGVAVGQALQAGHEFQADRRATRCLAPARRSCRPDPPRKRGCRPGRRRRQSGCCRWAGAPRCEGRRRRGFPAPPCPAGHTRARPASP